MPEELEQLLLKIDIYADETFNKFQDLTSKKDLRNYMLTYLAILVQLKIRPGNEGFIAQKKLAEDCIENILTLPEEKNKPGLIILPEKNKHRKIIT